MSDWPALAQQLPNGTIHCTGPEACAEIQGVRESLNTSTAWTTANRAIYIPFYLEATVTAYQMAVSNGATLNGQVDVGIYDVNGVRLVSIGSGTNQTGTSVIQKFDIADTVLSPGTYFMAMSTNSTTATFFGLSATNGAGEIFRAFGVQEQLSAFALPSSATFANPASTTTVFPALSIATHSVI